MPSIRRANHLDMRTLRVVGRRLTAAASSRGVLTPNEIRNLLSEWLHRDTVVPVLKTAGRIRKLQLADNWSVKDQGTFERHHGKQFVAEVQRTITKMNKRNSNRV